MTIRGLINNHLKCSLRQSLIDKGVLVEEGDHYRLAQDYTFGSPSLAASVMMARSANGRTNRKDASGRTLKEIQQASTDSKG
jgi:hypothetical protein